MQLDDPASRDFKLDDLPDLRDDEDEDERPLGRLPELGLDKTSCSSSVFGLQVSGVVNMTMNHLPELRSRMATMLWRSSWKKRLTRYIASCASPPAMLLVSEMTVLKMRIQAVGENNADLDPDTEFAMGVLKSRHEALRLCFVFCGVLPRIRLSVLRLAG